MPKTTRPEPYRGIVCNPSEITTGRCPEFSFATPGASQNRAARELRKFQPHTKKFDHVAYDGLASAIAEISGLTEGQWAKATREAPMEWVLSLGWTRVAVRLWKEW